MQYTDCDWGPTWAACAGRLKTALRDAEAAESESPAAPWTCIACSPATYCRFAVCTGVIEPCSMVQNLQLQWGLPEELVQMPAIVLLSLG